MFKKLTSAFVVIAMLASMFSFAAVFAADDLIFSQSFEKDLGDWEYWGGEKSKECISFVTDAKDGKKALKMVDADSEHGPGASSPKFSVTPGETYCLEANYKLLSGSLFGLCIRFCDSNGKFITAGDVRGKLSAGTEWNDYKVEGQAPEGAVSGVILLAGNKVNVCEIIIDNIKVYGKGKVGAAPAPSTPSGTSSPSIAPVTGDAVFADSFENGMGLWKVFSKKNIEDCEVVSTDASDGKISLHCVDKADDAAPAYIMKDFVSVKPGETYTASCDFKLVSGNSFCIMLRFFNEEKKTVSDVKATSTSTSWTNINATAVVPEGAVYCAILIPSFGKNIGEAYIDNVKLVCAKSETPEVKEETKLEKIYKSSIVLFIGSPNALVNGKKVLIDSANDKVIADTVDGRTLVPVRFIAENYGAEVGWDDPTQTVTLKLKDKTVTIVLNKNEIDIDGKKVTIDVPAQTIQDRTMLPLRAFVEQVMGKTIFWDDRGLIVITDEAMLDASSDKATIDTIISNVK